ncbi:MAG: glutathione S-transferase [Rhodospirillales bacterium]|nr:glutathione S-transferase [Rhodospirillales bacterium]
MLLRFLTTSPYVRKVMVTAIETGLEGLIEKVPTSPQADEDHLAEDNPLSKIPTLILEGGTALFDSAVICEYLDSLHDGPKVFPAEGPERWAALRRHALADGILDALVLRRYEGMRPENLQSEEWVDYQKRKVVRALDVLEMEAENEGLPDPEGPLSIGEITVGCVLGYLDLRFDSDDWRNNRPALASWYEDLAERPSMKETKPE